MSHRCTFPALVAHECEYDCLSSPEVQAALRDAAMRNPRVRELVIAGKTLDQEAWKFAHGTGSKEALKESQLYWRAALRSFERDEEVKP